MKRYAGAFGGLVGTTLLAIAALWVFPSVEERVAPFAGDFINPVLLATVASALLWVHLLLASGYRRLPFIFCSVTATVLVAAVIGGPLIPWESLNVPFHDGISLFVALALFGLARIAMRLQRINAGRFVGVTAASTAIVLISSSLPVVANGLGEKPLSYKGELDALFAILNSSYEGYESEVEPYVEEIVQDEDLAWEEQQELVRRLNERIIDLEADLRRFEQLRDQNREYEDEIETLKQRMKDLEREAPAADDLEMVTSYRQAVRPTVPIVRDFAAELAAKNPGPYHETAAMRTPSETGLQQVLAIHRYVANEWRYINDPLFAGSDYYSPADRTISAGLVGDCDDFAILLASAVEAIGGRVRILHGSCSAGGHAWSEVYLGDSTQFQLARTLIARMHPERAVSHLRPENGNDYWLPLDWQVGVYSCGGDPSVQYESR